MTELRLREFHAFEAAGRPFLYLVPSAAVFALDETSGAIIEALGHGRMSRDALVSALARRFASAELDESLDELEQVRAIGQVEAPPEQVPKIIPLTPFPLTTMVLNVTNQCNLSCTYCYEYGEDKIVDTKNGKQPKFYDGGDRARERRVHAARVWRQQGCAPHLLRRRDTHELQGPENHHSVRPAAGHRAREAGGIQPHHERHAAQAGRDRLPRRERTSG